MGRSAVKIIQARRSIVCGLVEFRQVDFKIEDYLDFLAGQMVVIEAVCISLELPTATDKLHSTLLKRGDDVFGFVRPNVVP